MYMHVLPIVLLTPCSPFIVDALSSCMCTVQVYALRRLRIGMQYGRTDESSSTNIDRLLLCVPMYNYILGGLILKFHCYRYSVFTIYLPILFETKQKKCRPR